MSRKSRTTLSVVEKLIEQRRLFKDWLTKIEAGVDGMPSHVVQRVRNDYRARLEAVMTELTEHHDSLRQALSDARARHDELEKQQQGKKDELAELRLRKHVGEMDDDGFRQQNGLLKQAIEGLARELTAALRDIERYEEILEVITAPDEPEREPPEEDEEDESTRAAAAANRARIMKVEPRSEPKPAPKSRTPAEDELAFLRKVTATPVSKVIEAVPPPAPPEEEEEEEAVVELDAAPGLVELPKEPEPPAPPPAAKPTAQEKRIKCRECGAPNLPTEWYCEKCGAELSSF